MHANEAKSSSNGYPKPRGRAKSRYSPRRKPPVKANQDIETLTNDLEHNLKLDNNINIGDVKALEVRAVDDGRVIDDIEERSSILGKWFGGERRGVLREVVEGRVWVVALRTSADGKY